MKRTVFTQTVTAGELPKDGESLEGLRTQVQELQSQKIYLQFLLHLFSASTIGAVLLALLFVSPWSAFLLLPPCAALGLFFWHQLQKGA